VFEIRDRGSGDSLFISPDRSRPRVFVTMEAKADHPGQIDAAVQDAIELLKTGGGGDVVIRLDHDDPTPIKAVRETILPPS
jgi:hypothetical protein